MDVILVKIADGQNVINKHYAFFQNIKCEFFPCHAMNDINCLFCYCPLYNLEEQCGGDFQYTAQGIKDCSKCTFPHNKDNYEIIINKLYKETIE